MPVSALLPGVVITLVLAERLAEILLHRKHVRVLRARGAIFAREDGFGLILAGQVLLFVLLPIEAIAAPWSGAGWWTWPALALALLAQALRYWAIVTLGERWTIRVVTLPDAPRIVTGPYRLMRHPNYFAVLLETLALPLAFGAIGTMLVAFLVMAIALRRRIEREDRALGAAVTVDGSL
ncbi:MAG: isoprenylcysteine carboxylmethyltransferase family protein [Candidatus Thermoplasmatota archaeon]